MCESKDTAKGFFRKHAKNKQQKPQCFHLMMMVAKKKKYFLSALKDFPDTHTHHRISSPRPWNWKRVACQRPFPLPPYRPPPSIRRATPTSVCLGSTSLAKLLRRVWKWCQHTHVCALVSTSFLPLLLSFDIIFFFFSFFRCPHRGRISGKHFSTNFKSKYLNGWKFKY